MGHYPSSQASNCTVCGEIHRLLYEGESVNRSQMDIKRKTHDIRTWKKKNIYFSTYPPATLIHLSHSCKGASKTPAQKSFDCCLCHFRTCSGIICHFRTSLKECLDPVVNLFRRQNLHTINWKHFLMNILCIESSCPQKTHKRTLLFGSTLLKHCRHFDYCNQPLNMRISLCYLDGHEAGLCCSLVIHIENLLHVLQLFYFHLCPIYWFSFVDTEFSWYRSNQSYTIPWPKPNEFSLHRHIKVH
jgi:hypothetical protein